MDFLEKDREHSPVPSRNRETASLTERFQHILENVRDFIDHLLLPEGLTREIETEIMKRFREKFEKQKKTYEFVPQKHYTLTVDTCMREAMNELLSNTKNRRAILSYLLGKVSK